MYLSMSTCALLIYRVNSRTQAHTVVTILHHLTEYAEVLRRKITQLCGCAKAHFSKCGRPKWGGVTYFSKFGRPKTEIVGVRAANCSISRRSRKLLKYKESRIPSQESFYTTVIKNPGFQGSLNSSRDIFMNRERCLVAQ